MKKFILLANLMCVSFAASSQSMRAEGLFKSELVSLQTIVLERDDFTMAASATVTIGPCAGSISGIGRLSGRTLTFTSYKKIEEGEACKMTVEFDSSFKHAKITEGEKCLAYHGASCGWEGQTATKR